MYINCQSTP